MSAPLWTVEAMAAAMGAKPQGALPRSVPGLSIDTRTHRAGRGLLRAQGRAATATISSQAALKAGAGVAVVAAGQA